MSDGIEVRVTCYFKYKTLEKYNVTYIFLVDIVLILNAIIIHYSLFIEKI
jgi:hypothetical protein